MSSSVTVTDAFVPSEFNDLNFFNKFAPLSTYNIEEFIKLSSSILERVNNLSEYSFVLSVVPFNSIDELSITKRFVL